MSFEKHPDEAKFLNLKNTKAELEEYKAPWVSVSHTQAGNTPLGESGATAMDRNNSDPPTRMYMVSISAPSTLLNNVDGAMCSQWQAEDTNHTAFVKRHCAGVQTVKSKPDCKRAVSTMKEDLETIGAELKAEKQKSATLSKAMEDNVKGRSSALHAVKAEVEAEKTKSRQLQESFQNRLKTADSALKTAKKAAKTAKKLKEGFNESLQKQKEQFEVKILELQKALTAAEQTKKTSKQKKTAAERKLEKLKRKEFCKPENFGFRVHADSNNFTTGAWSRSVLGCPKKLYICFFLRNNVTYS